MYVPYVRICIKVNVVKRAMAMVYVMEQSAPWVASEWFVNLASENVR